MNIEAIIFDCDGTLVDSERVGLQVLVDYVRQFSIDLTLEDALRRFAGQQMSDTLAHLERDLGSKLPDDFIALLRVQQHEAFQQQLQPIDGAHELLSTLSHPICIASNGPRDKMDHMLAITDLVQFFDGRIYSSYDLGIWKPDPALFLHAAHEMRVAPANCLVVEDSLVGIQAGLRAKMHVVALQHNGLAIELPEGVHRIRHLSEVHQFLAT